MHAVWMPPLSQTWMCVTAARPFSKGVHPTACVFLLSWWVGRATELCAGILVQRNVFLHTQWLVMGTLRTMCNCSLERPLSLIMATCRSVEMVGLLWKCSTSEGFPVVCSGQTASRVNATSYICFAPLTLLPQTSIWAEMQRRSMQIIISVCLMIIWSRGAVIIKQWSGKDDFLPLKS